MYTVKKVTTYSNDGDKLDNFHILYNKLPVFKVNCFLEIKGKKSINTSRQYSYKLCNYFNFLKEKRNKTYKDATRLDIIKFIDYIIFETEGLLYISKGRATYNTASYYLIIIKEF